MSLRNFPAAIAPILFLASCNYASTRDGGEFQPVTAYGTHREVVDLAVLAAMETFDAEPVVDPEAGRITIDNRNGWAGDTLVTIEIEPDVEPDQHIVHCTSETRKATGGWFNRSARDVSRYLQTMRLYVAHGTPPRR